MTIYCVLQIIRCNIVLIYCEVPIRIYFVAEYLLRDIPVLLYLVSYFGMQE